MPRRLPSGLAGLLVAFIVAPSAGALTLPENLAAVRGVFAGHAASFTLVDARTGRRVDLDAKRSAVPLAPCSTFKIAHALAALDEGVLSGGEHPERWDGIDRGNPNWNADQTLASALKFSAVWYFQRVATRLGRDRERAWLRRLKYGNETVGPSLTTFWLDGSLRLTPLEQADFLTRLFRGALPASPRAVREVKDALRLAVTPHGVLRGKTGTCGTPEKPTTAWFVGAVERRDGTLVFVTTLQRGRGGRTGVDARALTEAALARLGWWR